MAEIVNLNKARKAESRAARKRKAKERRGVGNASCADPDARRRKRDLDGKRLDSPAEDS